MERPRKLGRYKVDRLLGTGAFGHVYLATLHGAMGFRKRVAIKVIGKDRPGLDPRKVGQFVNEARLGETLHHPNIVAIQEFGQEGEDYFLVMEYIDGISLEGILTLCSGRGVLLPPDAVCDLGLQVCAGLDHAHNATDEGNQPLDLVHRDLKPANLMVDRTGTVRIVDFGIARAATNPYFTTRTGEVKGTPRYMAPEQVTGAGGVSPLVDIYSLGLVMCEMATNEPVFTARNIETMLYRVLHNQTDDAVGRLRKVAPDLCPVVVKALATSPSDRYGSAGEMAEALRPVWWEMGGRQRMAVVVKATAGLVPSKKAPSTQPARTVDAATVQWGTVDETTEQPGTWRAFYNAFADQLPDEPPEVETAAMTVAEPERQRPEPVATERPSRSGRIGVLAALITIVVFGGLVAAFAVLWNLLGGPAGAPVEEVGPTVEAVPTPAEPEAPEEITEQIVEEIPTPRPEVTDVSDHPEPREEPTAVAEPASPEIAEQPEGVGRIRINSVPWSEIWVDGKYKARTGVPYLELPVGEHRVDLKLPGTEVDGTEIKKVFRVHVSRDATVNLGCWNFDENGPCGG